MKAGCNYVRMLFQKGSLAEKLRQQVRNRVALVKHKDVFANEEQVFIVEIKAVHYVKKELKIGRVHWSQMGGVMPACDAERTGGCRAHSKHVLSLRHWELAEFELVEIDDIPRIVTVYGL